MPRIFLLTHISFDAEEVSFKVHSAKCILTFEQRVKGSVTYAAGEIISKFLSSIWKKQTKIDLFWNLKEKVKHCKLK